MYEIKKGCAQAVAGAVATAALYAIATPDPAAAVTFGYTGSGADTIVSTSITTYTIPTTGIYTIDAFGAQGGNSNGNIGGLGGELKANFNLSAGTILSILVGQQGVSTSNSGGGGGGGGTFVKSNTTILIAAGGGGGRSSRGIGSGGGGGGINGGGGGRGYGYSGGSGGSNGSSGNNGSGGGGGGGGGISTSFSGGSGLRIGNVIYAGSGGFGGGGGGGYSSGGGGGGSFGSVSGSGGLGNGGFGGSSSNDINRSLGGSGGFDNSAIAGSIVSNNAIRSENGFLSITFNSAPTAVPEPFTIVGTLIGGTAAWRLRRQMKSSDCVASALRNRLKRRE